VSGNPLIWTRDEKDKKCQVKPFPDKAYLHAIVETLNEHPFVIIEKCRQMIISTVTCLFILHETSAVDARRWLISRTIEKDSQELIRDKIRAPHSYAPKWYRDFAPITDAPQGLVTALKTRSYIHVAFSSARGGTASGFLLDEAAFQDSSRDIVAAAAPMSARILMISTPSLRPGGRFMKKKIDQAKEMGGHSIDLDKLVARWGDKSG
jgi:hypothetical protein